MIKVSEKTSIRISVCMASYNGAKFIAEQISSVLLQLSPEDELIISDDGSTDSTVSIIQNFYDPRIKLLQNIGRKGVTGNFENALNSAAGDYIFLCDQDDIWLPAKVETVLQALKSADCVLHNAELMDADGNASGKDLFSIYRSRKGFFPNLIRNTFVGCCMAFNRKILEKALPIPSEIDMHDMWLALISARYGRTALVQKPLMLYRRHSSNASTTSLKSGFSTSYQIKYRFKMLRWSIVR